MHNYNNDPTRVRLQANILDAKKAVVAAKVDLSLYNALAENNVYDNLKEANEWVRGQLYTIADEACEGAYNCGEQAYEQEFIVDGIKYVGTLEVEYGRHDKTYYFIDANYYTFKEVK